MTVKLLIGDCRDMLKTLPSNSVNSCISSPPYFGLRDYGHGEQIGLEQTPEDFIQQLVGVFREVHRMLRNDGTLWLNLGDSYSHGGCGARDSSRWPKQSRNDHMVKHAKKKTGVKPKNLLGIPWRVALALQADGWYLRQDIIWHKPNPMPESVKDRCAKAHEYIFLLSKSDTYYFDHEAVKEPVATSTISRLSQKNLKNQIGSNRVPGKTNGRMKAVGDSKFRNRRSVWTVATKPYKGAHFATFPEELITPCILAGAPIGGVVLDPFAGSGTTGAAAQKLNRRAILIELNPEYEPLIQKRLNPPIKLKTLLS